MLVGGSALYTRAILDRFEFPGTDEAVRARWEAELARVGPEALHARLAELDPEAAARMAARERPAYGPRARGHRDHRPPLLRLAARSSTTPTRARCRSASTIDRPTLDARIEQRVHEMYDAGLVAEVERLLDEGLAEGRTASRAIGYHAGRPRTWPAS